MRNAISYWAMRAAISGIAPLLVLLLVQLGQAVEHLPARLAGSTPGGFERYSTGSPVERSATP